MEKTVKKPGFLTALLVGAAGIFCVLMPPVLFVAGGLFGYLLLAGGAVPFMLAAAVSAAGIYLLTGITGLWILAMLLPASICLSVMLRKKASYFDTALFTSAIYTACIYLPLNLADILNGSPAFYTLQQFFTQTWAESLSLSASMPELVAPEQLALLESAGRVIAAQLPVYMPAALCAFGGLLGLFNLLLCVRLCRRAGTPIKPMHRFMLWQMPKSFMGGMIILALGTLLASLIGVSAMDAVVAAVGVIVLLPFAVQGLSVLWFILHVRRPGGIMSGLLVVILVFTFPMSILSLAIMGAFEQLIHLRRRMLERGNNNQDK